MYALITGASSGIGRDIARILAQKGYDLIIVARNENKLLSLKDELKNVNVKIVVKDLSNESECFSLIDEIKENDIEILINNAGFGLFGNFCETDINTECNMIDTNIKAPLILMKYFLNRFKENNRGKILNVASAAAFTYGPLMSVYYATKSYLYTQTLSIYGELKKEKSPIYIGVLCPGPVKTEFQERANVRFTPKAKSSEEVARYAVKNMFKGKLVIIPGIMVKFGKFLTRFISDKLLIKIGYYFQNSKN